MAENGAYIYVKSLNKYTTKLPQNILDLINKQIDVISETDINNLISLSSEKITQSSLSNKDDAEKAFSFALDETSKALTYGLVKPFIDRLEKPIASLSSTEIEPIYSIDTDFRTNHFRYL